MYFKKKKVKLSHALANGCLTPLLINGYFNSTPFQKFEHLRIRFIPTHNGGLP